MTPRRMTEVMESKRAACTHAVFLLFTAAAQASCSCLPLCTCVCEMKSERERVTEQASSPHLFLFTRSLGNLPHLARVYCREDRGGGGKRGEAGIGD